MVVYKRRNYRKRAPKKPGRMKVYGAAAKQLWSDVKKLKSMINVEYKTFETTGSATCPSTGTAILLNAPTRGDDYNNLDGRQMRIKSIQLYSAFIKDASAGATRVRWALVCDKTCANGFGAGSVWSDYYSGFRFLDNRRNVFVIREGTMVLDSDDSEKQIKVYKKIDMKTVFDDTNDGTIASLRTNALYLVLWSDQAAYPPVYGYRCRLRFIDN